MHEIFLKAVTLVDSKEKVRKQMERELASEAAARREAVEKVAGAAKALMEEKRAASREARTARLGSQVAAAHFEAGQMAEH